MKAKKQIVLEWALVWAGVSITVIALMGMLASGCNIKIPPCVLDGTCGPKPTPTPTPTPTPIPPAICPDGFPPGPSGCPAPKPGGDIVQGVEWEVVGTAYPSPDRPAPIYAEQLDGVMARVTGCAINSDCRVGQPQQDFQYRIVSELRLLGLFAGQQHVDLDEIAVGLNPNEVQGYHIYNTGGGKVVWSTGADWKSGKGAYRDTWHARSATDPGPGPNPNPEPDPLPSAPPPSKLVFDANIPRVKPANPNMVFWTVTPKVCDPVYCKPNQCCPYAPEGNPHRTELERKYAWPVWFGADMRDDNPFSADSARGVHVKVCIRDNPSICVEGNAP